MQPKQWFKTHDPGYNALRKAVRAAIIMPSLFAIGTKIIHNANLATFAALGSFSMLLLVDFTGTIRDRLKSQTALCCAGLAFLCLGTLASQNPWLAAAAMTAVGFGVIFSGVVSSEFAGAAPALLLSFILPVTLEGSLSSLPDRLEGWALASVVSVFAVGVLWPAAARDPLRAPAIAACRAIAARLRADVQYRVDGEQETDRAERDKVSAAASESVAALHKRFLATPNRPTGLTTAARSLVRLVDELNWINAISVASTERSTARYNPTSCAVKLQCASILETSADLLERSSTSLDELHAATARLADALVVMEHRATAELPIHGTRVGDEEEVTEFITSLDPSFRAQELSFAVSQLAGNIDVGVSQERLSWFDRLLGRHPHNLTSALAAAQARAGAHVERHSVWLHNSVRSAVGLGLAVLIADLSGVQHSFWVVLGTLSVLRSNALSTGQNAIRSVLGTTVGFVIGATLLIPVGTHTAVLWVLFPIAIVVAGVAPAAISFAAGQAAFTLVLVILFNIVAPTGWRIGLIRVEDVAIGCVVSLAVGLLFWPRGAAAALGRALSEAYTDSSRYLDAAITFGVKRCDRMGPVAPVPQLEANRAAAASRRLDDTFRTYLAERGAKSLPLSEISGLVTGVAGLRLAADAVLDIWERDDGRSGGDRAAARAELVAASEQVNGWYLAFANGLIDTRPLHEPQAHDKQADGRLIDAVRQDLREADGKASATAVRMIWTGDHLDAARRLQATLIEPARAAVRERAFN